MVRDYISVRATSRSGYIPPLEKGGRGRDRSPSLVRRGWGDLLILHFHNLRGSLLFISAVGDGNYRLRQIDKSNARHRL